MVRGAEWSTIRLCRRILPFDEEAALVWGSLMAEGTRAGRPRSPIDMMIAAVADANGCVLVSGNERHFWGLKFINPMRAKNDPRVFCSGAELRR